jgi:hypothetical protein
MAVDDGAPKPQPSETLRHRQIVAALATTGLALPGNVVTRFMPCGKTTCRCKAHPPQLHGPYHQWTRKIDGKTVTRWLSAEQAARYLPWFQNARRLRELLTELEAISLHVAERNEGWEPQQPPTGHRTRDNDTPTIKPAKKPIKG